VVVGSFTSYDGTTVVDCRTDPAGCVAGVVTVTSPSDPTSVIAAAYDGITFLPTFTGSPNRQLTEGTTVAVHGDGASTGDWSVAQCGRDVVDDPSPAQVAALCAPPTAVTPDPAGTFDAAVVVPDPLTATGGGSVPCGDAGCVLVLGTPDAPVLRSFGIAFGPTTIAVEPDSDVVEGTTVQITVAGAPADAAVYQCVLPLGTDLEDSRCGGPWAFLLDDWGGGVFYLDVFATIDVGELNPVDCHDLSCGFALFDGAGTAFGQPAPITFAPPASLSVTPSEGLLDGQMMTVEGRHLLPGQEYRLQICSAAACIDGDVFTPGPDGALDTTLPAVQRFTDAVGRHEYCRANCHVVLTRGTFDNLFAPYAMATGELTVTPSTGLEDAQPVQVAGSALMSTYAGPLIGPFASGGWALTQCDRAVLDEPTLFGAFVHCAALPPTRAVTIETSTLDTTFDAQAVITKILGGTTDCTAAPDACVIGLVRFEQDTSLSTHLVPVAFG
jgi:hypothetical protein